MLKDVEERRVYRGIRLSQGGPPVSHLFFADDTLLFGRVNSTDVGHLVCILGEYGRASGQEVNFGKSGVFFSKNTPVELRLNLSSLMGIQFDSSLGKYLGLLAEIGKSKTEMLKSITNKMRHLTED